MTDTEMIDWLDTAVRVEIRDLDFTFLPTHAPTTTKD